MTISCGARSTAGMSLSTLGTLVSLNKILEKKRILIILGPSSIQARR